MEEAGTTKASRLSPNSVCHFPVNVCDGAAHAPCPATGKEMKKIEENYQRITDDKRLFDIRFWQSQGDVAIFEAATEILNDYFLIRGKNADESRLQSTIETFRKS